MEVSPRSEVDYQGGIVVTAFGRAEKRKITQGTPEDCLAKIILTFGVAIFHLPIWAGF